MLSSAHIFSLQLKQSMRPFSISPLFPRHSVLSALHYGKAQREGKVLEARPWSAFPATTGYTRESMPKLLWTISGVLCFP